MQLLLLTLLPAAVRAPAPPGVYVALGASNTCGHGVKPKQTFQFILAAELKRRHAIVRHDDRCVPAAGPAFASSCAAHFIPHNMGFATLEYLPNMKLEGVSNNLQNWAELGALVAKTGALTVVVEVMEGVPDGRGVHWYAYPRVEIERTHAAIVELSRQYSFAVLLVDGKSRDADDFFHPDRRHLSAVGHAFVANWTLAAFGRLAAERAASPSPGGAPPALRGDSSYAEKRAQSVSLRKATRCFLGAELAPIVLRSSGFNRTFLGGHADKVGWEALSPNAAITLCASCEPLLARSDVRVGMLRGLRKANPPLGLVRMFCSSGCGSCSPMVIGNSLLALRKPTECHRSNCSYDPRLPARSRVRAMQTDFAGFVIDPRRPPLKPLQQVEESVLESARQGEAEAAAAGCACAITITNSAEAQPLVPGHRVVVRALVRAPPEAHSFAWANSWHFKKVELGFRRRARRARRRLGGADQF